MEPGGVQSDAGPLKIRFMFENHSGISVGGHVDDHEPNSPLVFINSNASNIASV